MLKTNRLYRRFLGKLNERFPVFIAKARYYKTFGRLPNLRQPKNLNEKILWLSLFSDISSWTRLADKYSVRKYVNDKGLSEVLVELFGVWDNVDDIDWSILPNSFVMKTTNGSGTNLIVPDKSKIDIQQATRVIDKWLHTQIATTTTEFHYRNIKPRVIAEEFLHNSSSISEYSKTLIDYKIWCFNGRAYYIWACSNRIEDSTEVALFDREWNYHPEMSMFTEHYKEQVKLVPKPENLETMLNIAEVLSDGFPVVRVDLYNIEGKVYFGEMTFTSLGGTMDFYTQDCLYEMGSLIDISNVKKVRNI